MLPVPADVDCRLAAVWAFDPGATAERAAELADLPLEAVQRFLASSGSRESMILALERQGFTLEKVAQVLIEAASATKVTYFQNRDGRVVDRREDPDHLIRLKAASETARIRNLLAFPGESHSGGVNVNVLFAEMRNRGLTLDAK